MDARSPKRIYTTRALEEWFGRLAREWESRFSSEELAEGQRLYRNGEVREIELSEGDAIIHGRFGKEDCYALMDWEDGKLRVRSSTRERLRGYSLAAAGLYEIEELVADEVPPLRAESPVGADEASGEDPAPGNGNGNRAPASVPAYRPDRRIHLKLSVQPDGLALRAFWQNGCGAMRPVYGEDAPSGEEVSSSEREAIIRLTQKARKAGFQFQSASSAYLLTDFTRIGGFCRLDLPEWEKHFAIERPEDLPLLARGVREVEVEAELDEGAGGLKLGWELRLEGQRLREAERRRLMRFGGQAVILPGRGLARIKREQADLMGELREAFGQDLPHYMVFSLFARKDLKLRESESVGRWRKTLSREPTAGSALPAFLRPYQQFGVSWLAHLTGHGCGALLADEMGLGKTLQVLTLLHHYPVADKPALIVCPASVVPVWQGELERFFPDTRPRLLGSGHDFTTEPGAHLWIASYTQLRRHKHLLEGTDFGYAVLDEAQQIKNPEAKVSQACASLRARRRVALTGTPVENRAVDLWALFRFLMPGLIGARRPFERALEAGPDEALGRLRRQIAPFILRRTKKDVAAELPPKLTLELACPLSELQRTEYRRLSEEGLSRLGNALDEAARRDAMGLFSLLTRLRQTCCDPGLLPWVEADPAHSGKVETLMERLEEVLANKGKAVIFSQFVQLLRRVRGVIEERFPNTTLYEITGKTVDRATPVKQFQRSRGSGIFLVSLRAGGTGITLHAADYVFLMDPWWNPAVEEQAIDRVHRIGQKKTVTVYRLIAQGTLEARIQRLKADKRALYQQLIEDNGEGQWRQFFSSLSELVALGPVSEPESDPDEA